MTCTDCTSKPVVRGLKQIHCQSCKKTILVNHAYNGNICEACSRKLNKCMGCGKKVIELL